MEYPLLSIIVLSSDRLDLLESTLLSLLNCITYPHFELIIYNHQDMQDKGWLKLISMIKGKYVLQTEEDWLYLEKGDWIYRDIVNNNKRRITLSQSVKDYFTPPSENM